MKYKSESNRIQTDILGVKIDITSTGRVIKQIQDLIFRKEKFLVVTPNPEQVVRAQTDPEFKKILNSANLSIPDAVGLTAAFKFLNLQSPNNILIRFPVLIIQGLIVGLAVLFNKEWVEGRLKVIKGRELFLSLIDLANRERWTVVLIGGKSGSAQSTANTLNQNFKGLSILGISGPELDQQGVPINNEEEKLERDILRKINNIKPEMVFVGFGAPKQEMWMYRNNNILKTYGVIVVGGTFDYISGTTKLPPKFIENLGLEWFWRLFTGSQRMDRIFKAIVEFPLKVFLHKLLNTSEVNSKEK